MHITDATRAEEHSLEDKTIEELRAILHVTKEEVESLHEELNRGDINHPIHNVQHFEELGSFGIRLKICRLLCANGPQWVGHIMLMAWWLIGGARALYETTSSRNSQEILKLMDSVITGSETIALGDGKASSSYKFKRLLRASNLSAESPQSGELDNTKGMVALMEQNYKLVKSISHENDEPKMHDIANTNEDHERQASNNTIRDAAGPTTSPKSTQPHSLPSDVTSISSAPNLIAEDIVLVKNFHAATGLNYEYMLDEDIVQTVYDEATNTGGKQQHPKQIWLAASRLNGQGRLKKLQKD